MKTIKIFLASSEELSPEREKMADLVLHLNKLFKGRGIELDLEKWEYLDASMSGKRKQDEYNDVLHQCDICMVLFWRRFGSYTGEELDVAYKSMLDGGNPQKIYVFFKSPNSEDVSQEVRDFIKEYEKRYGGHFFCKFHTVDTMKLEFLLQLENYQKDMLGEKTIEVRNEHVYVDNEALVDLNNVPFAANNEDFQKKRKELAELKEDIRELREKLEKKEKKLKKRKAELDEDPDDEDCQEEYNDAKEEYDEVVSKLQVKLNRKNQLEEEFQKEQECLFNTARHMSELRGQRITERMARAIEAFEEGDAHRANIILEEAERDADQALDDIRQAKKIGILSIDELMLKTSTIMSDTSIPIDARVEQASQLYQKAITLAKEINYEDAKYIDLIKKYAIFLYKYAQYKEALSFFHELLAIQERTYGIEHPKTVSSYINIGQSYSVLGDYEKAMVYYHNALGICEEVLGTEHQNTATSYYGIGFVYSGMGEYDKAREYYQKALKIWTPILGAEHPDMAMSYNSIGCVYYYLEEYDMAREYFQRALEIREKVLGTEHPDTARSYNNIGNVHYSAGNYDMAMEYYQNALGIWRKVLGTENPDIARSYNNIGLVYSDMGEYDNALEFYFKSLGIWEKIFETEHPDMAILYSNIGETYNDMGDYDKALEYHQKAIVIREKVLRTEHPDTASSYNDIAWTYHLMEKYEKALPWAEKAVEAYPDNPKIINTLATVYKGLERYNKALEQFELCLKLQKEQNASKDSIHETEEKIASLKEMKNEDI